MVVTFVIMAQVLYPDILAVYAWITHSNPEYSEELVGYCAMILFIILTIICNREDISIFLRLNSFGVIFVILLMVSILLTGLFAFKNTEFSVGTAAEANETDW